MIKCADRICGNPTGVRVKRGRRPIPVPDKNDGDEGDEQDVETLPRQEEPRLGGRQP